MTDDSFLNLRGKEVLVNINYNKTKPVTGTCCMLTMSNASCI